MKMQGGGSADSHVIRYRADIDGLRAIAVLSVVIYHLSRSALPGGYLGVDMFFVISGFLITSIIWREARDGQFSIIRFYDRRVRRIMPALLLVLFLTLLASVVLLLPSDLIGYGRSTLATLGFVGNIYFWRDTDYFSAVAENKPLLHMWSLGVEEQFYLVFPIILALLARLSPRAVLPTIAALTLGSLSLNILALFVGGDSPAFFLLPTRAWELGIGALVALLPVQFRLRLATANVAAVVGALMVLASLFRPTQWLPILPAAILTVPGTALLILAGQHETPAANRVLCLRPFVFVGLISYSLYLWHWPIIVFAQYYLLHHLGVMETVIAVSLMTAGAVASWRFVERPFRSKGISTGTVRLGTATGVVALAGAAAALALSDGLPRRLSADAATINQAVGTNYRCPISNMLTLGASRACEMNLPSRNPADADVVLLGNSHAQMYAPVWVAILAKRGQTGLLVPANGCLPTVKVNIDRECVAVARRNLSEISGLTRARTVILGTTWPTGALVDASGAKVDNRNDAALIAALDDLIDQLQRAGKQVVLIGPIAQPGWDVASIVSRQLAFGWPMDRHVFLPASDFALRFDATLRHFESRGDIGFARPDQVQCRAERCDYLLDGRSLFADSSHIAAAELPRFRAMFEAALPPLNSPLR